MADLVLRVEELRKRFCDVEVLKGVSLTLSRGEVVALLGPSGSGTRKRSTGWSCRRRRCGSTDSRLIRRYRGGRCLWSRSKEDIDAEVEAVRAERRTRANVRL